MRQLRGVKTAPSEELTTIGDFADMWEVDTKTVENWTEVVYLAFDTQLPRSGPFPEWGRKLLEIVAKHISKRATLYFAETQENRRLKSSEFIRKVRHLRKEGHFEEFEKFQKFQKSQDLQRDEEDEDLETVAELATLARQQDEQIHQAKQVFEAREDEQIEELAAFMENSDTRRMSKLARRLRTRAISGTSTDQAVDVTFRRLN